MGPPYREDDALGGHDPYSASKAAAELVTASYRDAFLAAQGVAVATARAGNVIGGATGRRPPSARCGARLASRADLHIRRPQSTRPWQHVLEPLAAYSVWRKAWGAICRWRGVQLWSASARGGHRKKM